MDNLELIRALRPASRAARQPCSRQNAWMTAAVRALLALLREAARQHRPRRQEAPA